LILVGVVAGDRDAQAFSPRLICLRNISLASFTATRLTIAFGGGQGYIFGRRQIDNANSD
jgi:hypothetical protein